MQSTSLAKLEAFEASVVDLAAFAKALAHPARIRILRQMAGRGKVPSMGISSPDWQAVPPPLPVRAGIRKPSTSSCWRETGCFLSNGGLPYHIGGEIADRS